MVHFLERWNVNGFRQGTIVVNGFSMVFLLVNHRCRWFFTSQPLVSMVFPMVFPLVTMVFQWFFTVEPLVPMIFQCFFISDNGFSMVFNGS